MLKRRTDIKGIQIVAANIYYKLLLIQASAVKNGIIIQVLDILNKEHVRNL